MAACIDQMTSFTYTTYIHATPERVWQGLTDPAFTKRYWRHQRAGEKTFRSDWKKVSTYECGRSPPRARQRRPCQRSSRCCRTAGRTRKSGRPARYEVLRLLERKDIKPLYPRMLGGKPNATWAPRALRRSLRRLTPVFW